jgi:hypothetical protein
MAIAVRHDYLGAMDTLNTDASETAAAEGERQRRHASEAARIAEARASAAAGHVVLGSRGCLDRQHGYR